MGGATNICSDKTGTLTQNKMTGITKKRNERKELISSLAVKVHAGGVDLETLSERIDASRVNKNVLQLLMEGMCVNSTTTITRDDQGKEFFNGPPTEGALLIMARKMGYQ